MQLLHKLPVSPEHPDCLPGGVLRYPQLAVHGVGGRQSLLCQQHPALRTPGQHAAEPCPHVTQGGGGQDHGPVQHQPQVSSCVLFGLYVL